MEIENKLPTVKNPPEYFTGDVWLDAIAAPKHDGQRMIVSKVRFAPGARTAWLEQVTDEQYHCAKEA